MLIISELIRVPKFGVVFENLTGIYCRAIPSASLTIASKFSSVTDSVESTLFGKSLYVKVSIEDVNVKIEIFSYEASAALTSKGLLVELIQSLPGDSKDHIVPSEWL